MFGLIRKGFYLTLGTGVLALETVDKAADYLIKKGESTKEEAAETTKETLKHLKKDVDGIYKKAVKRVDKIATAAGVVSLSKYKDLEKRVKDLETSQIAGQA